IDRSTAEVEPSTAWTTGILALTVVGAAMIGANVFASRCRVSRSEILGWTGAAVAAGALLLWARAPESTAPASNPIPISAASIEEGSEVYAANCVRCHGQSFAGDGPDAGTLPARPADLVLHFPQHSDGQHAAVIKNGRPASGMPAWEGVLTENEI